MPSDVHDIVNRPGHFTIGLRFDIPKVRLGTSTPVGVACWEIVWRAVDPSRVSRAYLYSGRTRATLRGGEEVYCAAIQNPDARVVTEIKAALGRTAEFLGVCAEPAFVEGHLCTDETLISDGQVDANGDLIGVAHDSRVALGNVRREREPSSAVSPEERPERQKPASERTRELPHVATFAELGSVIESRFTRTDLDRQYECWVTPQELCDLAEQYSGVAEVHYREYGAERSEDMCGVWFFEKAPSFTDVTGQPQRRHHDFHGVYPFPSEPAAKQFIERYRKDHPKYAEALPQLGAFIGRYQVNFEGRVDSSFYHEYSPEHEVPALALWGLLHKRMTRFGIHPLRQI